jgi:membrane-bound lytic murein transglycosylase D
VELADFKELNPQLKQPVILAAGTPQILLPWDNAAIFKRNFESYSEGKFATWTAWNAPTTMTVAEAARRVGMTEADLRSVNSIPPRMLIKAGSTLIVPRSNAAQGDVASHVADNAQLSLAPEIVTRRLVVKAGRHDSVASIARRYHVNPVQVAEWNHTHAGAAFRAGQQVVLEVPVRTRARQVHVVRTSAHVAPVRSRAPVRAVAKPAPRRPVAAAKKKPVHR